MLSEQTLVDWDYQNPYALLQVVEELLQLYKAHQEHIIEGYHRLQFEYSSLIDQSNLESKDIETHTLRCEVGDIENYKTDLGSSIWTVS